MQLKQQHNFSLYELTNKYQEIYDNLISDPDVSDEILSDCLNDISGDIKEKISQIGLIIKNIDAFVSAMENEKDKISKRISCAKNRISNMKSYLIDNMNKCDLQKVSTAEIEIKLKNCPESVVVDDASSLNEKYFRTKISIEPDKKLILQEWKKGEKIDGITVVKNKSITII